MDWNQPRDRLAMRAYIRGQLRSRGMLEFADDDAEASHRAEQLYLNCGTTWLDNALRMRPLAMDAIQATTTDVPQQGIDNTLLDDGEFWSSTGSGNTAAGDCLLYRLHTHLGRVAYVGLSVYRAHYQHGEPMYPPRKVSFLTGPTPNQLYPASPIYPVRLTDGQQVFALTPTAAVSEYLMVRLHGRMQRQWEDLQYYIAIRHVQAYGSVRHPTSYIQVARIVPSRGVCWPCTLGLAAPPIRPSATPAATALASVDMREGSGDLGYSTASVGTQHDSGGGVSCLPLPDVYELNAESSTDGEGVTASPSWWRSFWTGGRPGSSRVAPSTAACGGQGDAGQGDHPRPTISASARAYMRQHRSTSLALRSADADAAASSSRSSASATAASGLGTAGRSWVTAQGGLSAAAVGALRIVPTGPTDAELQLALQQDDIARALRHLVNLSWPEVCIIHTTARLLRPYSPTRRTSGGEGQALARQRQSDQAAGRGAHPSQGRSGTVFGKGRDQLSNKTSGSDSRHGLARSQSQSALRSHEQEGWRMGEDVGRPAVGNAAGGAMEDAQRGQGFKDLRQDMRWCTGLAAADATGHGRRVVPRMEEPVAATGTSSAVNAAAGAGPGVPAPPGAPTPPLAFRKHRAPSGGAEGGYGYGNGGGGSACAAGVLRRYYQEGWRRRCQHVARLAMRPSVYRPAGPLFVAMDCWGEDGGLAMQAAIDSDGSCGEVSPASAGSWLISHYDNEHL